jgi:hypothetical protein
MKISPFLVEQMGSEIVKSSLFCDAVFLGLKALVQVQTYSWVGVGGFSATCTSTSTLVLAVVHGVAREWVTGEGQDIQILKEWI